MTTDSLRLTAAEARRAKRLGESRRMMLGWLQRLDDETIATLLVRHRYAAADEWPAGSGGGKGGSEVSRPTEAAALRILDGQVQVRTDDGVRSDVGHLLGLLDVAEDALAEAEKRRERVLKVADDAHGRRNTVELCAGCNEPAPKVLRLDGQPYHHPNPVDGVRQPQCWRKAYREQLRGREQPLPCWCSMPELEGREHGPDACPHRLKDQAAEVSA